MLYKRVSNSSFFLITESTSNDGDQAYCLRCTRLYTDECSCVQCEDCKNFYADIVAHKCTKTLSFCMDCFMDHFIYKQVLYL